jgi:hypothetical protein
MLFLLLEITERKQNPAILDSKDGKCVIMGDLSASEIVMGIRRPLWHSLVNTRIS